MMGKTIFACLLIATIATAIPNNDIVPEEDYDAHVSVDYDTHTEAANDLASLLQAGKTKDACAQLADSTAKQVSDSIASAQTLVNAVPKGAVCKNEGQAAVDSSKKQLDAAKTKAAAAKKAADSAKTKPVKFKDVTIAEIKAGDCSAFFSDPSFTSAKTAAQSAADAHAKADGEQKAAQKAHDDSLTAQKAAVHACACHAQTKHNEAKKAADKANSAENAKAWSKAYSMKCVLDGKTAASCKIPTVPKVTMPALQEPAKSAQNCGAVHFSGKEISLYFKTGSTKNSQSNSKATVTLHGSTGKSWSTKVSPPGNNNGRTDKHKVDVNLGSVTSVTLGAGGTDGWLLVEMKVDGTDFSQGLPAWVDGTPYDKADGYAPYRWGDKLMVSKGKACKFEKGKDFRGPSGKEDIKKVKASNAADCDAKCLAYSGCQYFAFVDNGDCYLKHNYSHKKSNSRVTSGFACQYEPKAAPATPAKAPATPAKAPATPAKAPASKAPVVASGAPWIVNKGGDVFVRDSAGSGWTKMDGNLKQIAAAPNNHVWGVNSADTIFARNNNKWEKIAGKLTNIAVNAKGVVWGVNKNHDIFTRPSITGNWQHISGKLKQIAVNADGRVWGVNKNDDIFTRPGVGGNWQHISGKLSNIAVEGDNVWGISKNGDIFSRNGVGGNWKHISGKLQQLSVGTGNTVWGVTKDDIIYTMASGTNKWVKIGGAATWTAAP